MFKSTYFVKANYFSWRCVTFLLVSNHAQVFAIKAKYNEELLNKQKSCIYRFLTFWIHMYLILWQSFTPKMCMLISFKRNNKKSSFPFQYCTRLINKIENNSTWEGAFYQSEWVNVYSSWVILVFSLYVYCC